MAYKCNARLAQVYLGQCIYESEEDFMECDYFKEMVMDGISESKKMIQELNK